MILVQVDLFYPTYTAIYHVSVFKEEFVLDFSVRSDLRAQVTTKSIRGAKMQHKMENERRSAVINVKFTSCSADDLSENYRTVDKASRDQRRTLKGGRKCILIICFVTQRVTNKFDR